MCIAGRTLALRSGLELRSTPMCLGPALSAFQIAAKVGPRQTPGFLAPTFRTCSRPNARRSRLRASGWPAWASNGGVHDGGRRGAQLLGFRDVWRLSNNSHDRLSVARAHEQPLAGPVCVLPIE